MFIARRDPQVRNVTLLMNGISYLLADSPTTSVGSHNPNCRIRITAPTDGHETAETLREMAETI